MTLLRVGITRTQTAETSQVLVDRPPELSERLSRSLTAVVDRDPPDAELRSDVLPPVS